MIKIDMTSKEFLRRSDYFNMLDSACISISGRLFCWKITQVFSNSSSVFFTHSIYNFFQDHPAFDSYCDCVYIEKYSTSQFAIDLVYFKAFLSRLSNYQMKLLKASGKCSHLLSFLTFNDNQE